jgi:hypothetical protein
MEGAWMGAKICCTGAGADEGAEEGADVAGDMGVTITGEEPPPLPPEPPPFRSGLA